MDKSCREAKNTHCIGWNSLHYCLNENLSSSRGKELCLPKVPCSTQTQLVSQFCPRLFWQIQRKTNRLFIHINNLSRSQFIILKDLLDSFPVIYVCPAEDDAILGHLVSTQNPLASSPNRSCWRIRAEKPSAQIRNKYGDNRHLDEVLY